jgi:signal transduction histidine kinase
MPLVGYVIVFLVGGATAWLLLHDGRRDPNGQDENFARLVTLMQRAGSGLEQWVDTVADDVRALLGADQATVLAVESGRLAVVGATAGSSWPVGTVVGLGESLPGFVWATGAPVATHDFAAHPACRGEELRTGGGVVVPGRLDDCVQVVVAAEWDRGSRMRDDRVPLLALIADALAASRETTRRSEQAQGVQSRFLTLIGHEVRTPLTSILGACDLLSRSSDALAAEERAKLAALARRGAARLEKTMSGLLVAAQLEQDLLTMEPKPVPLRRVVDAAAQRLRTTEELVVDVPLELGAMADEHLGVVLDELLDNAARHGRGPVRVSARRVRHEVRLDVADSGDGLADDMLAQVRRRFARADSRALHEAGAGLGLYLADALVERLGGRFELWSEPAGGCHATVWLPAAPVVVIDVAEPAPARTESVTVDMRTGSAVRGG